MTRVLLVDDNETNLFMLENLLRRSDYETARAKNGVEALSILEAGPDSVDIVLLDRMMPEMDGLECLKRMKADPRFEPIPVIMQTALTATAEVAEGIRAGAFSYLGKPLRREVLLATVEAAEATAISRREMRARLEQTNKTLTLADFAEFSVRTFDDVRMLATGLAPAFPDPNKAALGLSELMNNAIEHGNLGLSYEEKSVLLQEGRWADEVERRLNDPQYANLRARVRYDRTETEVKVTISDKGKGFNFIEFLEFDPARAFDCHGRGIAISKNSCFDDLEYVGCGNQVVVKCSL